MRAVIVGTGWRLVELQAGHHSPRAPQLTRSLSKGQLRPSELAAVPGGQREFISSPRAAHALGHRLSDSVSIWARLE